MKITVIIIRSLAGLLLLFASVSYFFKLFPQPEMHGAVKTFNMGIGASVYLMPLIKATELVCGLAYITGRYVTLANVMIFPVVVNIFLFHAFLAPEGIAAGAFLLVAVLFLVWNHRRNYSSLFRARSFE